MKNFRALSVASEFYRASKTAPLKGDLRDQLLRAASSACLNLAEGRGRRTRADQLRHFHISLGSIREAQAILMIEDLQSTDLAQRLDKAAAAVYLLIRNAR